MSSNEVTKLLKFVLRDMLVIPVVFAFLEWFLERLLLDVFGDFVSWLWLWMCVKVYLKGVKFPL